MHQLKLELKPKVTGIIISSMKGVSGSAPGIGAMNRMAGERKSQLFRGKGLEFDRFREFTPDDDATMIDWKASLRSNKTLVKAYSEEQNKDIVIFLDVSSTMTYSSIKKLKAEYAAELAATLVFNIVEAGDNAGLVMFTDKATGVIPPMSGASQYHKVLKMLQNTKLYEGKMDLSKALGFLNTIVQREAIIILISDFIGLKTDWKRSLEILSARMELIGIMVRDPLDDRMPEATGQVVLSDPYSPDEQLVDPKRVAEEYEKINRQFLSEVSHFFKKMRSDLLILHTDENFVKPLRNFFMGQH